MVVVVVVLCIVWHDMHVTAYHAIFLVTPCHALSHYVTCMSMMQHIKSTMEIGNEKMKLCRQCIRLAVLTFFPPPFFGPSFPSKPWTLVMKPACCKTNLREKFTPKWHFSFFSQNFKLSSLMSGIHCQAAN